MGTDLSIVNAARVSMDKASKELSLRDIHLLNYLATNGHWTPFAHTALSFRITLPIFAARQLMKSTVGIVVNEVSRRYVTTPPTLLDIHTFRGRAPLIKQGSLDEAVPHNTLARLLYRVSGILSTWAYRALLALDVCPEQARSVLAQSMLTTVIWTGSLAALHRIVTLRTDEHAQRELNTIVSLMAMFAQERFPNAWNALTEG